MNIKEIVQIPYTTSPKFTPINDVIFKEYTQDAFEQRVCEFNALGDEVAFESDIAKKECLVEKTSRAMQLEDEPFFDIIDMGLEIPDDVIIMHKGKVEAAFVAMASSWNPGKSFHRHVWGISPLETLSNHPDHKKPIYHSLDDLYFRVEHERTLTVDKDTAAFFIDVEVMPLSTIFHLKEEYRSLIKDSINSMSENILAYKNLKEVKEMINVHD